ncbi:hypothetical protein CL653_00670 [bacterium]|nr:hypothetical protein [bacterium]
MVIQTPTTIVPREEEDNAKQYDWHAHTVEEVLAVLGVDGAGLSKVDVARRNQEHGFNRFSPPPKTPWWSKLLVQAKSPLSLVLLFALAVTTVLEEYIDASVIGLVLVLAVIISIFQEGRASKAFNKLAKSQTHTITVFRDGGRHEISAEDLVPGDIVELQSGVQVPADLRLLQVKDLSVNESPLTGEWLPVKKNTDPLVVGIHMSERINMAFKGTFVAEGYGIGVVVAIGDETEIGLLASSLNEIQDAKTPVQYEMEKVSRMIIYIILALIFIVLLVGLWQGNSFHDMALLSVAIAVASIPEGLPAIVSVILAVGMEAILKKKGLVRNILAAETLGSTTYVLTDKTGTLTIGEMEVTGVIHGGVTENSESKWHKDETIKEIFSTAFCAIDAYLDTDGEKAVARGDGVEKAILEAAVDIGLYGSDDSWHAHRVDYLPFNSENRFAAGLAEGEGGYRLCINGAPEFLLEKATHIVGANGRKELSEDEKETLLEAITLESSRGKRLVAVAYKDVEEAEIDTKKPAGLLNDIVFLGVLVLHDPVRQNIKHSIKGVLEAGAKIVLVTGDNSETALFIAKEVGIAGPHETALTGSDLETMADDEILRALVDVHVFARVLPRQKMRLAELLQRRGEIVAMTGDGINDAPALKKANIGVAIGSGTEVAKEASDLILIEDSFSTIYSAIEEGRRIITNLRKIIGYLLATSLTEVALIVSALVAGMATPLLPVQILWANIVEEGLMGMAFAFEKGEKGAMKLPPRDIHHEGVLSKTMIYFLGMVTVVLGSLTVSLYFYLVSLGLPIDELRSAMFLSISIDSLFIAFAFRTLSTPIWKTPFFVNRFFFTSLLLSLLFLFGAIAIPFTREILSYTPLPAFIVALTFSFAFIGFIVVEIAKMHFFAHSAISS